MSHFLITASPQSVVYHSLTNGSSDDDLSKEAGTVLLEAELHHDERGGRSAHPPSRKPERTWLRHALVELLPSFLHPQRIQQNEEQQQQAESPSPTAWLDGLRGYAAFFVVWHHMSLIWFSWSLHDGYSGRETDHLVQLPIVRLAIAGPPHVFVFFVISGYALSHKTLRLLLRPRRDGGKAEAETYATIASSAFRRHPRLFVPPVVLCLPTPLVAYAGWFGGGGQMPGAATTAMGPAPLETLGAQFRDYARTALEMADPLARSSTPDWTWVYNPALWTLPHEFRGSLLVYGALLALSRCRSGVRLLATAGMAAWALYAVHWPQFLFLSGMLLADLRLHSCRRAQPQEEEGEHVVGTLDSEWKPAVTPHSNGGWKKKSAVIRRWWSHQQHVRAMVQVAAYIFVLYVLGAPPWHLGGEKVSGFIWLGRLVPSQYIAAELPDYFWTTIAAVALVFVLDRSPLLQRLFTTRFARYLGQISYSLYLVHVPILHSLGWWTGKFFLGITGSETDSGYVLGVAATAVVVWVATIWMADLGWRFVDAPAVRFAGWIHRKVASR